jgi:hypothetical protein
MVHNLKYVFTCPYLCLGKEKRNRKDGENKVEYCWLVLPSSIQATNNLAEGCVRTEECVETFLSIAIAIESWHSHP